MRIPVLAFALCMLMAPCASNAMDFDVYEKLEKEAAQGGDIKEPLDFYLMGVSNAFIIMNSVLDKPVFCDPKKIGHGPEVIRKAIDISNKIKKFPNDTPVEYFA